MNISPLPDRLSTRRPVLADCEAILELFNSFDIPKYGQPNQSLASIRNMLTRPGFNLETDAWLVITPSGQFAAYIHVMKEEENSFGVNGGVHPAYCRQGIGTHLLRLAEMRVLEMAAQIPASVSVTLSAICLVNQTIFMRKKCYENSKCDLFLTCVMRGEAKARTIPITLATVLCIAV